MAAIEKIEHGGVLYATIFRRDLTVGDGVKFLTPSEYPLQLGVIERREGYAFRPHIHLDKHYEVNTTQEFLYLEKGRMKVQVYTHDWKVIFQGELKSGDIFFSITGGHSFDVLEDVRLIEVKQGPYPGEQYAKRFKE